MLYTSPRRFAAGLGFLLLLAGLLLASFAVARPAHAASYSAGTYQQLYDAIDDANNNAGDDTISLTANIVLTDTLPDIASNITIEGNGHTIDGNNAFYIFYVDGDCACSTPVFILNNATLTNAFGEDEFSDGVAIYNYYAEVHVTNVTFSHNISTVTEGVSYGGAVYSESGIFTIENSRFLNNESRNSTGAGYAEAGAIYAYGTHITINNTSFVENKASTVGSYLLSSHGAYGGAILNDSDSPNKASNTRGPNNNSLKGNKVGKNGTPKINRPLLSTVMTVTNSTFARNQAVAGGASIEGNESMGGAIYSYSYLAIVNSTFAGNSAVVSGSSISNYGAGGAVYAAFFFTGLNNSTLVNNNVIATGTGAETHGRILAAGNEGILILKNSIVALTVANFTDICDNNGNSGTIANDGNNLQYPGTSCGVTIPTVNPGLDPAGLKNNGGPTQTVALLPGSPAINTADPVACPPTDQRGVARSGICDIGAYEFVMAAVENNYQPPADLIGQLRITPDRLATTDSQNLVSYIFTVKNVGQGEASAISFELPVDPNLVVGYTEFNDPEIWVSSVTTASVVVSLPNLTNGEVVSGTIFFRPNTAPVPAAGTEVTSRYTLKFTNPDGSDKMVWSNAASTEFGGSNTDVSQGVVQLMMADAPDGSKVTYHSHFWIPNEIVTAWVTKPDGTSEALPQSQATADAEGHFMVTVDTAGWAPGTYVIAAYGARSEEYGSGVLVVTEAGSSAKPATGLGVKSLGAKVLAAPKSR